jgi:ATP-binding cassette subfamily F protein uup
MAVINIQNLTISFGRVPLLDGIDIQIHDAERICLLGRNGAGKSTLMRLITGEIQPDSGTITAAKGVRCALLPQGVPSDITGTVRAVIAEGLPRDLLEETDEYGEHHAVQAVKRAISHIGIDPELLFESLSAGWKRRVLLGRALVSHPDVLLLDEPTNHLDIEAVQWLEDVLLRYDKTVFFVTHDRSFLQRIANRIVELDRGKLYDWKCDYKTFLDRKEAWLAVEESRNALFDKKLAVEEEWIKRGVKARRTRNEGRVKSLVSMREERSQRRVRMGNVKMDVSSSRTSGDIVIEAKDLSFGYDKLPIVTDFSTVIERGDKVGIIGPNGCGKSTLIRLLLREIEPLSGSVRTGTKIDRIYFDQLRGTLDEEKTVRENVSGTSDTVDAGGRSRHVLGYLRDFLFTPDRAIVKTSVLSGGEKNRLLLAKFFARPSNFIVMDEPTNDLDIETIELLEELLLDYQGTLLLVSHDRAFLNNIVTSILSFDGDGRVGEYAGGYDDWLLQRKRDQAREEKSKESGRDKRKNQKQKFSFAEKKEFESLPQLIEQKENRKHELYALMADPEFYKQPGDAIAEAKTELDKIGHELDLCFARWEELGSREQA